MPTLTLPTELRPTSALDADPLANRLWRHYAPLVAQRNVLILTDGTVTEDLPPATYNDDGSLNETPEERIAAIFWGGCGPWTVTDAQATLLTAAGYTVT